MADTDEAETDVEHAVIAHYRLADDGLGEPSQWEIVRQAQSLLTEAIEQADVGEFDGNEYGGGEVVLYAYGPDAEALFAVMAPILNDLQFRPAHVVLRYGSVDDPSAAEHRVDLDETMHKPPARRTPGESCELTPGELRERPQGTTRNSSLCGSLTLTQGFPDSTQGFSIS
ncbi:hypothetical protein [Streptomyces niveus]|uniref:hypothetical protein n=1 Tax=Streptomyces niveus TaxID=193462 RepID=UPI003430467F